MDTKGRVALVTGGAAGIGQAIARRLARAGYDIAIADIDATGAEAAAKELRESGRRAVAITCDVGDLVNIASWNGKLGAPNFGAYSAAKFAVIGLTQALAREVAGFGIRVNAVCPGIVAGTPMRREVERQGQGFGLPPSSERAKTVPLGRLAVPGDIANAVAFLASDEAAYMTGQAINVTGGLWLH